MTVILLNGIATKLALRYGWYIRMTPQLTFPVTDACYDYLDRYVMDSVSTEEPLRIIFCDEEQNIRSSGTQAYVLTTATELAERYPGKVRIEYLNVWENPSVARAYGVKASTSVVVAQGESLPRLHAERLFPVLDPRFRDTGRLQRRETAGGRHEGGSVRQCAGLLLHHEPR